MGLRKALRALTEPAVRQAEVGRGRVTRIRFRRLDLTPWSLDRRERRALLGI